jgi:hypothetical protein
MTTTQHHDPRAALRGEHTKPPVAGTRSNAKMQIAVRLDPADFAFVARLASVRRMQLGALLRAMVEEQMAIAIELDDDAQQVAREQGR